MIACNDGTGERKTRVVFESDVETGIETRLRLLCPIRGNALRRLEIVGGQWSLAFQGPGECEAIWTFHNHFVDVS